MSKIITLRLNDDEIARIENMAGGTALGSYIKDRSLEEPIWVKLLDEIRMMQRMVKGAYQELKKEIGGLSSNKVVHPSSITGMGSYVPSKEEMLKAVTTGGEYDEIVELIRMVYSDGYQATEDDLEKLRSLEKSHGVRYNRMKRVLEKSVNGRFETVRTI